MIKPKHLQLPNLGYVFANTYLGKLLGLVSKKGLVALEPAFTPAEEEKLLSQLTAAEVEELAADKTKFWQKNLATGVKNTLLAKQLPLHLIGTPLQQQAWLSLAEIPLGTTLTYKEFALKNGRPQAIRALASTCATNPLPFLLPCHRVVGSNGGLGGFYYGLEMKQQLLNLEKAAAKEETK